MNTLALVAASEFFWCKNHSIDEPWRTR